MDFVIGFGANRLNPLQVMPAVRMALAAIFSEGVDPWIALIRYCTVHHRVLGHTTIILVDRNKQTGQLRGRQIVYSHPYCLPWGIMPECRDSKCLSRPGDVYGVVARNNTAKKDIHSQITLNCKVCNKWCIVHRPDWITPITDHKFYFEMPWPLTAVQRRQAMGHDGQWTLQRPMLPPASLPAPVVDSADAGGVIEIESIDITLANAMETLGRVPIWDAINMHGGIGHGLRPAMHAYIHDEDDEELEGDAGNSLIHVMSPVSPDRSRSAKRTKR